MTSDSLLGCKGMVELKNVAVFRQLLADYQPSEAARAVLRASRLVAVVGLAGGGRNTVFRRLAATGTYEFVVSDTTRPPKLRDGRLEKNGVDYFFCTEEEMRVGIEQGMFLGPEVIHNQQVSGVNIHELERVNKSGKIAVHDFEYGGADEVARLKPDAFIIGLLPPNFDEWQRRWSKREELSHQEFLNRMQTAEKVLENMLTKPYFTLVINDDLDTCVQDVRDIVENNNYSPSKATTARRVAEQLYEATKSHLA